MNNQKIISIVNDKIIKITNTIINNKDKYVRINGSINADKNYEFILNENKDIIALICYSVDSTNHINIYQRECIEINDKDPEYRTVYSKYYKDENYVLFTVCNINSKYEMKGGSNIAIKDGKIISEHQTFSDMYNGRVINYDENGFKSEDYTIVSGKRHGNYITYYQNGQIKSKVSYNMELIDGLSENFYINGQIKSSCNYTKNMKDGLFLSYHIGGKLGYFGLYRNDVKIGPHTYLDENGNIRYVETDGIIVDPKEKIKTPRKRSTKEKIKTPRKRQKSDSSSTDNHYDLKSDDDTSE